MTQKPGACEQTGQAVLNLPKGMIKRRVRKLRLLAGWWLKS